MVKRKGFFINFEGIDGSGTSTHVHELTKNIETYDKYLDVLRTHEPWRSEIIKDKLKNDVMVYSDGLEMAKLYVEDRAEHYEKLIRPNFNQEVIVLNSRFKMSTCSYQWAQGVNLDQLLSMHENRGLINPDITFF